MNVGMSALKFNNVALSVVCHLFENRLQNHQERYTNNLLKVLFQDKCHTDPTYMLYYLLNIPFWTTDLYKCLGCLKHPQITWHSGDMCKRKQNEFHLHLVMCTILDAMMQTLSSL